jgi:hypothetical protein
MAGHRKKMRVSDEVLYELLQENEYGDISESEYCSDTQTNMNISPCCEQSVSSDDEKGVSDNSSMQHGIWAKSGAERTRIPFIGKPGINVDMEDPFELFSTPEIVKVIVRDTSQ